MRDLIHTRRFATMLAAALATVLALSAFSLALLPSKAFAAGNEVGSTFESGGLTYKVTEPVSEDNDSVGNVTLFDGKGCAEKSLTIGRVSFSDGDGTYEYEVTAIAANAFKESKTLESIEVTCDLTGSSPAIGNSSFEGCTALKRVALPQKVASIGSSAFKGCTSLESVSFADDAELYTTIVQNSSAIGSSAFEGCTALKSFVVPAIMSATRFGDSYFTFNDYNPETNQTVGISSLNTIYSSGYDNWWHSGAAPVCREAFGSSAFKGCAALETVVFEAGAHLGAYAYFYQGNNSFEDCSNLKSVVFESEQAYAMNPHGAMHNATYDNMLDDLDQEVNLYYAVDYYVTDDPNVVNEDDARASQRLARVEVKRGASVGALQAGDAEALADSLFSDASLYASKEGDGAVPDPNEAAREAGLDASSTVWAWKLTGTQSQRAGITESCSAYLVPANDLSAGRIAADPMTALQKRCDQNFSRWIVDGAEQDSSFDANRYFGGLSYEFTIGAYSGSDVIDDADALYFIVYQAGEESVLSQMRIEAADGTVLDPADCSISYQRYDFASESLREPEAFEDALAALGSSGGPLLVTIEPVEGSWYEGSLQVWVFVRSNSGSVVSRFTSDAAGESGTWYAATSSFEVSGSKPSIFTSTPYAVRVGQGDLASALVAAGFAGLAEAPINVDESDEADYGFYLSTNFSKSTGAIGAGVAFAFGQGEAYADKAHLAAVSYQTFESDTQSSIRGRVGASKEDFPWGTTALLVDQSALQEVAGAASAYAYAAKAPVFYVGEDGTVSDETRACLADFERIVLLGYPNTFSADMVAGLELSLGGSVVDGGLVSPLLNASYLSRRVADRLMDEGLATAEVVTVADASEPMDAIGALNRSGFEGGISLVCTSSVDAKETSLYLRGLRDDVSVVRLFGREGGNALTRGFDLSASLGTLWDERGGYDAPSAAAGDTIEINGYRFEVDGGSGVAEDPLDLSADTRLWGAAEVPQASFFIGTTAYELAEGTTGGGGQANDGESGDPSGATDLGVLGAQSGWTDAPRIDQWSWASPVDKDADGDSGGTAGVPDSEPAPEPDPAPASSEEPTDNPNTGEESDDGITPQASSPTSGLAVPSAAGGTGGTSGGSSTPSSGTSSGGTSGSGRTTAPGTALDTSEDDAEGDAGSIFDDSDDQGWSITDIGNITDPDPADSTPGTSGEADPAPSSSSSVPPYVILLVVAGVVAAIGGGVWYLLRRRNSELFDDPIDMREDALLEEQPA